MKYILIIGDGMADDPVEQLDGRTPLESVEKPHIDKMSMEGVLGSVVNCPPALPAGSDTAILSIFGCDPMSCYTGRAPLEAAAQGIELKPGDMACRCNMVSISDGDLPFEQKIILSHSAGSIDGESSIELVEYLFHHREFKELADKAGMRIEPSCSYRHIAVQSNVDITGLVLKPPHDHLGELVGPNLPSGGTNSELLCQMMELSNKVLDNHPINEERRRQGKLPANCIWFWAEGTAVQLPSFTEKYHKNGVVISAVPLCKGIARLIGLEPLEVEGATGELETNYEGKAKAAADALAAGSDFAAIHVEAPDECTHNGDLPGKLMAIENLNFRVVEPLMEYLKQRDITDYRVLLLSDHKTLTATGAHDGAPVPFLLYDSTDTAHGSGLPYTEENGLKGIKVEHGTELMGMLFSK